MSMGGNLHKTKKKNADFYWESILAASFSFPVAKAQTLALNITENVKINYTE